MGSGVAASPLDALVARYDPAVADPADGEARIRLEVRGGTTQDALAGADGARLVPAEGEPTALLSADAATWARIAADLRGGMAAYNRGRLRVRRNLHAAIGFLAATSGNTERGAAGALRFRSADTPTGRISYLEAGAGDAVVALHGLGATKASLLPTVVALADEFRMIALDLPGFGDSAKPIGAPYDARFFAETVVETLDALGIDRAHLIGNSLGGRVALELGLRAPDRVRRMGLLAPSMAWRRKPPWASLLRFVPPELGLLQPTPRGAIEAFVERTVPGASDSWVAAGIDEFLRAYLQPRGRAAFYAAARQIVLEEPDGPHGFWPRLQSLDPEALWVWGRQDTVVPIAFARHVTDALPHSRHLELDCGHVPQLERPQRTHAAVAAFLRGG